MIWFFIILFYPQITHSGLEVQASLPPTAVWLGDREVVGDRPGPPPPVPPHKVGPGDVTFALLLTSALLLTFLNNLFNTFPAISLALAKKCQ